MALRWRWPYKGRSLGNATFTWSHRISARSWKVFAFFQIIDTPCAFVKAYQVIVESL